MKVGDYETLEEVGSGAFGTTFRARHTESGDIVALKQLRLAGLEEWKPVERFEREAKVLRSLSNPGVVRFIEAFDEKDDEGYAFYLVSEFVDGPTLGKKIADGARWDESQVQALLEQLLETLEYLHGLSPRVVHRDIKPGNIVMADDDRPVLVDFGAVADFSPSGSDGGPTVAGTPGYMAPEQAMGAVDHRSDLYGLGATMVHVLTHVHPMELPRDGLDLDLEGSVGCSPFFIEILERLLEPDPAKRFQSAEEALRALRDEPSDAVEAPKALARKTTTALVPAAPRPITPAVRRAMRASRHAGAGLWIGFAVLTVAFAVIYGLIAASTTSLAFKILGMMFPLPVLLGLMAVSRSRSLSLYAVGTEVQGRVRAIQSDNRHQVVHYDYEVDGERRKGRLNTQDILMLKDVDKGDPIHVFYDPESPGRSIALLPKELDNE